MTIPKEVLERLEDGSCICYDGAKVACMSDDVPKRDNAPVQFEIDRENRNVVVRHVIYDEEESPLYVEYFIDKEFLDTVSSLRRVEIQFVSKEGEVRKTMVIHLSDEEIQLVKREMRVGN
ncbi:hypothetical protein GWK48_06380 [Metallosphaera tengchongensis]|uniref:Uncharacterized protein n=2 Tax=Metallosphaera tengchongensis TaxID=1532350 RepID=A0A6N0P0A4_9CREN|nr:hypothetical protein GWK48_06380 [Metallosphaera tengchongensis]